MNVRELSEDQLDELKFAYFYQLHDTGEADEVFPEDLHYPHQIPDDIIYNHYDGIDFVPDDFCCTCNSSDDEDGTEGETDMGMNRDEWAKNGFNVHPDLKDVTFPCGRVETNVSLDFCQSECPSGRYYSCDTVAMANDALRDAE